MRKYINKNTKIIIEVDSEMRGDWTEIKSIDETTAPAETTASAEVIEQPVVKEQATISNNSSDAPAEITKKQIIQELEAFGIEHDKRASKQELYELMLNGK